MGPSLFFLRPFSLSSDQPDQFNFRSRRRAPESRYAPSHFRRAQAAARVPLRTHNSRPPLSLSLSLERALNDSPHSALYLQEEFNSPRGMGERASGGGAIVTGGCECSLACGAVRVVVSRKM